MLFPSVLHVGIGFACSHFRRRHAVGAATGAELCSCCRTWDCRGYAQMWCLGQPLGEAHCGAMMRRVSSKVSYSTVLNACERSQQWSLGTRFPGSQVDHHHFPHHIIFSSQVSQWPFLSVAEAARAAVFPGKPLGSDLPATGCWECPCDAGGVWKFQKEVLFFQNSIEFLIVINSSNFPL